MKTTLNQIRAKGPCTSGWDSSIKDEDWVKSGAGEAFSYLQKLIAKCTAKPEVLE